MSHIPEGPANVCENVFFSLDENGEPNVKEVVINATTYDELSAKIGKVRELSPDNVILNGTIHSFDKILEQVSNRL